MLLDAGEVLSEQDQRVIAMAEEAGRALVLAFNKWDLVDEDRREAASPRRSTATWPGSPGRPRVNVSALTGRAVDKLGPAMRTALAGWETRIPTAKLNSWIGDLIAQTPPPVRSGKQPKVLFATQAGTRPPRFVLFTSGFLEAGYRRFIERRLREDFGFVGTPDRGQRQGAREAQQAGRAGVSTLLVSAPFAGCSAAW